MSKQTLPNEYGHADAHGPSIIAARNAFLSRIHDRTHAAWGFVSGDDDE